MSASPTRRAFLQTTAALTAAAALAPSLPAEPAAPATPYPENGTLIPDDGWHLWLDREAKWAEDDIHLPEELSWQDNVLCANAKPLPVNAPTGGWSALTPTTGKQVLLPTSVEQHFWATGSGPDSHGEPGTPRPYLPTEYRYAADYSGGKPASPGGPSVPLHGTAGIAQPPADDAVPINGAYFGVSWWHRPIAIPAEMRGKRIFLHIRGAHLRAEVYLNGKLCGYSIMEELPFEADLSHAADPGSTNHLAIRITNPFGRYDWLDGFNAKWGHVSLYRSHGFGALDRGMTLTAHNVPCRISDAYVLNTEEPTSIIAHVYISNWQSEHGPVAIAVEVIEPGSGKVLDQNDGAFPPTKEFDRSKPVKFHLETSKAKIWSLDTPNMYNLRVSIRHAQYVSESASAFVSDEERAKPALDTRTIAFAFRSFTVDGLSSNALFRLNGNRVKLYSSISWGFWGLNGMFPVPELAEKEVTQAKKLNLNCLNFHRNLAKEDVLRAQDRLGLLRYMEPGAGKMAIGKLPPNVKANDAGIVMEKPASVPDKFAQRYMFVKCVEMVKAFRSHPSVIVYCLQNEIGADLSNPDTLAILKAMHDEDPSRCVVLNDGFVAPPRKAAQAWYEPWSSDLQTHDQPPARANTSTSPLSPIPSLHDGKLHRSDEEPWGAWWNQHQGAGDQWYDEFYKSPTDFTYRSPERAALSEFGEMEGCATPDNHSLMLHQQTTAPLAKYGSGLSYDRKDHEDIDAATSAWLSKWNFRKAFSTTEHLWNALGKKCYDTWQNYLENARISDDLDFAVISGWESTAVENHSGIVDNLRNFKSDPSPIRRALEPVIPIAKQRSTVVSLGQSATFDLFLLNDTAYPIASPLNFFVLTPSGRKINLKTFPPPKLIKDQFSYLLQEGFTTPPLTEEGLYQFRFLSYVSPLSTQTKDIWVTEADISFARDRSKELPKGVGAMWTEGKAAAVSGISAVLRKQLEQYFGLSLTDFKPGEHYDLIISSGLTTHTTADKAAGETTGLESAPPPSDVGPTATTKEQGTLAPGILDAVRAGTPLLCIPQANTLSDGCAKQLAAAGAFTFYGNVGDYRAPWMGNWYFVREHPLYAGMPVNQAMGMFYQCKGREANGLVIDGSNVEIIAAYSRDHDRKIGAGTFTCSLGKGKIVYHRCPDFHPVLQQRFLANALRYLTS